jgi:anti-sigma B factor antagonist
MALTLATEISDDAVIFRCSGRIVVGDEDAALPERVKSILMGTPKIVIDLSGVDYIDSGGIGILVGLHLSAKSRGGDLKLVSPSQRVEEVLGRTKLNSIFSICKTIDDALAAFSGKIARKSAAADSVGSC